LLELSAKVYAGRAEALPGKFDCVVLRAVDRMRQAVQSACHLVSPGCWLALMTTEAELEKLKVTAGAGFLWMVPIRLPGSDSRVLALGQRPPVHRTEC
jgi:16S rRNA G527 N7-methylase RsmG